ncbi:hypothetical protein BH11VER1_BH11VER1_24140 [soil metagenome]
MMVGITAWQQQVPLPQAYTGSNAWRIPLHPVVANEPASIKGRFLRGAIALAVNGIPIFNPQNNRGEVSAEIGELDQWGGHCGRADDYHYHAAPLHLQSVVGQGLPIAYALDGYPIYGLSEPDGSAVGKLDVCNGHELPGIGYHYHASTKYPYVNGGFHGEVVEAEGQVDPQPRARTVRQDTLPLRGALITGFESPSANNYKLSYTVGGDQRSVAYAINSDGTYPFTFDNGSEGAVKEIYTARKGGGGGGGGPEGMKGRGKAGQDKGGSGGAVRPGDVPPRPEDEGSPSRPQAAAKGILDMNGDGVVTAQEYADAARRQGDTLESARVKFQAMDRDRSGQLEAGERQVDKAPVPVEAMRNRGGRQEAFVPSPDQPRSSNGSFLLTSSAVEDGQEMPAEFTGDGEGVTLPLEWKGAPAGTQEYALIMDHTDQKGDMKWYWTLYELPANITSLPKNMQGIGKIGTGFKGQIGYEPPHSQGPGAKSYILTLYALDAPLRLQQSPGEVNREVLLAAIKGKVLASSSLRVVHTSKGGDATGGGGQRPRPQASMNDQPSPQLRLPMSRHLLDSEAVKGKAPQL